MSGIRAVIFDLDGTLLDTLEDIGDSMNAVLRRHGFQQHGPESYKYFVGDGIEVLVRRSLPPDQRSETMVAECLAETQGEYAQRWSGKTRPYDGIAEMLDALAARGVRLAVLSNKPDHFTKEMIEHYFGPGRIEPAFGTRPGVPHKPDPAVSLEIARILAIPVEAFLHVGDTPVDMKTAHAAGMLAVGATWGFRKPDELAEAGADFLVDHPREVLKLIEDGDR